MKFRSQELQQKFERISKCISGDLQLYEGLHASSDKFESLKKEVVESLEKCETRLKQTANSRTIDDDTLTSWAATLSDLESELDRVEQKVEEMKKEVALFEGSVTDKKPHSAVEINESKLIQLRKALKMKLDSVTKCQDTKKVVDSMHENIESSIDFVQSELTKTDVVTLEELDDAKRRVEKTLQLLDKSKAEVSVKDGRSLLKVFPASDSAIQKTSQYFKSSSEALDKIKSETL